MDNCDFEQLMNKSGLGDLFDQQLKINQRDKRVEICLDILKRNTIPVDDDDYKKNIQLFFENFEQKVIPNYESYKLLVQTVEKSEINKKTIQRVITKKDDSISAVQYIGIIINEIVIILFALRGTHILANNETKYDVIICLQQGNTIIDCIEIYGQSEVRWGFSVIPIP